MCEHKKGYFGLSEEELVENPQLRALADDGVVAESGWNEAEQAEAERRVAASKEQISYQSSPYDSSK